MGLQKIPVHLSLLIDEQQLFLSELSKLVCWAIASQIHYITIYDNQGKIKSELDNLKQKIEKQKQELFGSDYNLYCTHLSITKPRSEFINMKAEEVTNSTDDYHIRIVSLEDGRWDLVETTKRMCDLVDDGNFSVSQLDEKIVHSNLCSSDRPDPDLIIKFGNNREIILNGFLPWQMRFCEMLHGGSLKRFTSTKFMAQLHQYSNIDQRFGK